MIHDTKGELAQKAGSHFVNTEVKNFKKNKLQISSQ